MTKYSPTELVETLGSGLLSFPVTHFDADLQFDEPAYRAHLEWLSGYDVAGLFAAGGTGEGFSLNAEETDRVVRAAIAGAGGKVPVLAPATGSTVQRRRAGQGRRGGRRRRHPAHAAVPHRGRPARPRRAHQRRVRRDQPRRHLLLARQRRAAAPTRSSRPASAAPTSSASRTGSAGSSR